MSIKKHDEIWPELVKAISNCGIYNYSIYYDEVDGTLFNYLEVEGDFDRKMKELANLDIEKNGGNTWINFL